jgi:type I restriction enzyme S subunit
MKLETFFEKFDQFADAPDAVAKMRELVLELAVRGRLLSSGNLDSSAPSDPFPIPHDWQWIALNKAADCRAAAKVDSASLNDSDWVLDLEDIDGGAGKVIATATFAERRSLSTKASFQKGDVLYGKLRPYLNKVVIADRPGFCTTEIIPLRPQKFVAAGYLRLFLRSPHFLRYAAQKNYGMKMPRLGTQDLESAAIPLPPLAEQTRIVAKVDELMALCDRLEAQQQERETRHAALARASLARFADAPTPANLPFLFHPSYAIPPADLRKSILTLAVQGKLVPQDPDDEPAEELLATVERDKAEMVRTGAVKPFKHLLPVLENEVPNELPPSWKWVRTEAICEAIVDCPHSTPVFIPSGIVCLDTNGFKEGQLIPHKIRFVSEETYEDRVRRLVPRAGDIVFAREGSVGASVIVPQNMRCCLGQRVMLFRLMSDISPRFFSMALSEASSLERLLALHKGIGAKHVNVADMRNALIPLPPLAEQRRIVAKVEQLMALVDALETQLAASRATAANLLSALVAELTAT